MRHICAREAAVTSPVDVFRQLEVNYDVGLTNEEAELRLNMVGPNSLQHVTKPSIVKKYIEQFSEPMILLLLVSASISFLMRQYDDTVSITTAVIIVVSVAFVQNYRSEKALEALKKFMPHKCNCLRGGRLLNFLASDLVPGDIVYLSTGDRIPADLRLFEAVDMRVDESSLTGETEAVLKTVATLAHHSQSNSVVSKNPSVGGLSSASLRQNGHSCASPKGAPEQRSSAVVKVDECEANALNRLRGCHDLTNIAFMGTLVCCGKGKGVVIGTGEHSEFGEVFCLMKSEESPRTPLQKNMDKLGKQLSFFSLLIIGSIVAVGLLQRRGLLQLINVGVSLAVAAIPEGLPIVVTVTLAIGQMRMASRNAVVRRLPAVETLGCVNVICADKTGTMTKNEMTASQLVSGDLERFIVPPSHLDLRHTVVRPQHLNVLPSVESDKFLPSFSSSEYHAHRHSANDLYSPHLLSCPPQFHYMVKVGAVCNNAVFQNGALHGQPTEGALLRLAEQLNMGDPRLQYTRVQEWPFSSESKMMMVSCVTTNRLDQTVNYFAKGAVDRILNKCVYVVERDTSPLHSVHSSSLVSPPVCLYQQPFSATSVISSASHPGLPSPVPQSLAQTGESLVKLTPSKTQAILSEAALLGSCGLRVLAFADGGEADQLTFRGLIGLMDPPRAGVEHSVQLLLSTGVRVIMITGDAMETACTIGTQLGLHRPGDMCLSGEEVEQLSLDALKLRVRSVSIFYRSGPRHKCKIVKALQKCGLVVAMTGDGVNDAVALKSSDIGVAMGCSGTDVCREASDIVLLDDNFATILSAMEEGKAIFHNIRNFVGFQLSTSIAALSLIALSTLMSLPTPLNAMQILYINILMDGPPAQSLGVEPPDENIAKQPPRRTVDSLLDARLIVNVVIAATTIVTGTLWIFYLELDDNNQATARDTTMTFTCFVFFDMFNALSFRCQKKSVLSLGLFSNRMFVIAIGLSLFGQLMVIYLPPLQAIFQTEALSIYDISLLVMVSSSVFFISEIRKLVSSGGRYNIPLPVQLPRWLMWTNRHCSKVKLGDSMV